MKERTGTGTQLLLDNLTPTLIAGRTYILYPHPCSCLRPFLLFIPIPTPTLPVLLTLPSYLLSPTPRIMRFPPTSTYVALRTQWVPRLNQEGQSKKSAPELEADKQGLSHLYAKRYLARTYCPR